MPHCRRRYDYFFCSCKSYPCLLSSLTSLCALVLLFRRVAAKVGKSFPCPFHDKLVFCFLFVFCKEEAELEKYALCFDVPLLQRASGQFFGRCFGLADERTGRDFIPHIAQSTNPLLGETTKLLKQTISSVYSGLVRICHEISASSGGWSVGAWFLSPFHLDRKDGSFWRMKITNASPHPTQQHSLRMVVGLSSSCLFRNPCFGVFILLLYDMI